MNIEQFVIGTGIALGGAAGNIHPKIDPLAAGAAMGVGVLNVLSSSKYPQQLLAGALERGEFEPREI